MSWAGLVAAARAVNKAEESWIGVDFDGTLAENPKEWKGPGFTGRPIMPMVDRVKAWLAEGKTVKILTARVASTNPPEEVDEARAAIEQWTEEQFGRRLDVVSEKDPAMTELWDDRAVRVKENAGEVLKHFLVYANLDLVWKAVEIGDVKDFGGTLFVRIKKTDGKWGDYKKLGKKPEGWKSGDKLPEQMQTAADQAQKKPAGEKKPEGKPAETPVPPPETAVTPKGAKLPPVPQEPKEAAAYMQEHLGWKPVVHPANEKVIPMLAEYGRKYVEEFPFLKGFLNAIGDNAQVQAELGHPGSSGFGTLAAVHYGPQFKGMGLGINFKNYGNDLKVWEKNLVQGVTSGFHPEGTGTLQAIIDHEMGHVMTKALHTRDPELKKLWQSVGGQEKGGASQSKCRTQLSAYAATNIGEFISEGWAEYRNNPKPRPLAKAIGERYRAQLMHKHELIEKYLEQHVGPDLQAKYRKDLWAKSLEEVEKMGGQA